MGLVHIWLSEITSSISILPALSKILERIVHSQLYEHIDKHNILSNAQFGFRKGHSTSSCILNLLDTVYKNVENNKLTGVIFLDLKKAFDTVDHNILLNKLRKLNIHEHSLNWFGNYLNNRHQSVKLLNVKSILTVGCPKDLSWGHYYLSYILMILKNISMTAT